MQLEETYAGPLKDTVIQRWRDPANGTTCYIYLPIIVRHAGTAPSALTFYDANAIGSISCVPRPADVQPRRP